ncbi:hypothetical protein PoB_006655600 [Plakobranchus ocellatus]|uniref:Uncharacterized protein n=1 Tax=Plakobranchus ocellatus TaxID=259542 RepID=A0AAV4D7X3_9GAST|nr:hypothetical protein PoB_006655600 [Plakobranchus ocellatus]
MAKYMKKPVSESRRECLKPVLEPCRERLEQGFKPCREGFKTLPVSLSYTVQGCWGVDGTVASESALRSAQTLLSRVRAPPPAPWPDRGPESLRSPCCGLAIYKNPTVQGYI